MNSKFLEEKRSTKDVDFLNNGNQYVFEKEKKKTASFSPSLRNSIMNLVSLQLREQEVDIKTPVTPSLSTNKYGTQSELQVAVNTSNSIKLEAESKNIPTSVTTDIPKPAEIVLLPFSGNTESVSLSGSGVYQEKRVRSRSFGSESVDCLKASRKIKYTLKPVVGLNYRSSMDDGRRRGKSKSGNDPFSGRQYPADKMFTVAGLQPSTTISSIAPVETFDNIVSHPTPVPLATVPEAYSSNYSWLNPQLVKPQPGTRAPTWWSESWLDFSTHSHFTSFSSGESSSIRSAKSVFSTPSMTPATSVDDRSVCSSLNNSSSASQLSSIYP